jgi:hypothetical protein
MTNRKENYSAGKSRNVNCQQSIVYNNRGRYFICQMKYPEAIMDAPIYGEVLNHKFKAIIAR